MKRFIIIISLITTFLFSQDRSVIFNTGSPDSTTGYLIDMNHSIANRITINNNKCIVLAPVADKVVVDERMFELQKPLCTRKNNSVT